MRDLMNILNENQDVVYHDDMPTLGCVIDPNGGVHAIRGLDDIMLVAEKFHPELDQLWEDEWEPAEEEYPEKMFEYIMEKGWIEVLGEGRLRVAFENPSNAAKQAFYRLAQELQPTGFVLNGKGNRIENVADVHLALTKMGE